MNMNHILCRTNNTKMSFPDPLHPESFHKILVFIPHPDDEAIGCGGLLAQLGEKKSDVKAILVSDGSGAGALPEGTAQIRQNEFLASLQILGITKHALWNLPDGQLDTISNLSEMIEKTIQDESPDIVVAPWYLDIHNDHSAIGEAVKRCADLGLCQVLFYEIWTPLECTHVLDISHFMEPKINALKAHHTALQYGHYLEAMKGLALYRGLYLSFDTMPKYAEAYSFYARKTSFLSLLRRTLRY